MTRGWWLMLLELGISIWAAVALRRGHSEWEWVFWILAVLWGTACAVALIEGGLQ